LSAFGLEAGPLSQWLYSALAEAGLPVICVETRHMKAAPLRAISSGSTMAAKSGLAQLRMGMIPAGARQIDWIGPKHHHLGPAGSGCVAGVIMENRTALITVIEHASEPGVWRIESLAPTDRTTALRAAIHAYRSVTPLRGRGLRRTICPTWTPTPPGNR
jgi:hypothetical protein